MISAQTPCVCREGKPVSTFPDLALVALEILHGAFVLFRRGTRLERAEIAALAGLRIDLARIEPVLT